MSRQGKSTDGACVSPALAMLTMRRAISLIGGPLARLLMARSIRLALSRFAIVTMILVGRRLAGGILSEAIVDTLGKTGKSAFKPLRGIDRSASNVRALPPYGANLLLRIADWYYIKRDLILR